MKNYRSTNRLVDEGKAYIQPQRPLERVSPHTRLASGQRFLETAQKREPGFPRIGAQPQQAVLDYREWLRPQGRRAALAAKARLASEPPSRPSLIPAAYQASDKSIEPTRQPFEVPMAVCSSQSTPKNLSSSSIPFQYIRAFFKACIVLFLVVNGLYIASAFAIGDPSKLPSAYLGMTQGIVQTVRCGWTAPVEPDGWGCWYPPEEEE